MKYLIIFGILGNNNQIIQSSYITPSYQESLQICERTVDEVYDEYYDILKKLYPDNEVRIWCEPINNKRGNVYD